MSAERRNYRIKEQARIADATSRDFRSPFTRGRRIDAGVDLSQLPNKGKRTSDAAIPSGTPGAPNEWTFGRSKFGGADRLVG